MAARSVLVTGCNRGLGLELARQLLGRARVFAACRDPSAPRAQELRNLASRHPNLVLVKLDVLNPESITEAARMVEDHLNGLGLNLLINNAGVYSIVTLETVDSEEMVHAFKTNLLGPLLTAKAFLPLLKKAAQRSPEKGMSCRKAAIVNISTVLASLEKSPETFYKPVISYRCSKAALNMLTRCQMLSYREDGILCAAIHPGWVKTDMGTQEADLTVDESVRGILTVLSALSEKHNGSFLNWLGEPIPW